MDLRRRRGAYKTNIDPILLHWAHFWGPNAPGSEERFQEVRKTAEKLLTMCEDLTTDTRPFSKRPPYLIGELIDLVRLLPPYDSIEFKLLHPVTIAVEWCRPLDIERGISESAEFAKVFNDLFERSTQAIRKNERRHSAIAFTVLQRGETVVAPVESCAFWGTVSITGDEAEILTEAFWRLVLKRNAEWLEQQPSETIDDWMRRLGQDDDYFETGGDSGGTIEFDSSAFDLGEGRQLSEMEVNEITLMMDRVGRFGLSQGLADFLMQEPMWDAARRMTDLYEAFYLLNDIAYLGEHGLTEVVLNQFRRPSPRLRHTHQLIVENGYARERRGMFWSAIADEDIRTAQIRTCKILDCRKIFWAKAKNQLCCSPRCSNLYHVQNYRYKSADQKAAYVERQIKRERARLRRVVKSQA